MKFILLVYFTLISFEKVFTQNCIVGDACRHKRLMGVNTFDDECEYFDRLKVSERYDHGWCGFKGKRAIICCPIDGVSIRLSLDEDKNHVEKPRPTVEDLCKSFENVTDVISNRILGGSESAIGEFPHFAILGYRKGKERTTSFDCGGTLISSKHVITAAHCCKKSSGLSFVRLGATSNDIFDEDGHVDVKIEKVTIHPSYKLSRSYHDIAIIELKIAVDFSKNIRSACLSRFNHKTSFESLTIAGFGRTNIIDKTETTHWLLKAKVEEIPLSECRDIYQVAYEDHPIPKLPNGITDDLICASNRTSKADSCEGDSGSGLMLEDEGTMKLVGVTSFGIGCGTVLPSFYTRVSSYIDWIEETLSA